MLEHEKSEFLLCTLDSEKNYQVDLDLIFSEGEMVTFYVKGEGTIHLTGYLMDFDDEEEDDSDLDFETAAPKRKLDTSTESPKKKQLKVDNKNAVLKNGVAGDEDDEDDEEDDDFDEDLGLLDEADDLDDEEDEELDDEEDDEEESEDNGNICFLFDCITKHLSLQNFQFKHSRKNS